MDQSLPNWCKSLGQFPDTSSFRLYECAKRDQWNLDVDIDWQTMDLSVLAPEIRRAMASIYTQLQFGEVFGLAQTSRALADLPRGWARLISATQVMDEARHVEFFSRVVDSLGHSARVSEKLVEYTQDVANCDSPDEAFLGTQIILESFAQAVFVEGTLLARRATERAVKLPGTEIAVRFLNTVGQYIGRDEARHVAFGVLYLRGRWQELGLKARDQLQRRAEHWSVLLDGLIDEVGPELQVLGISKQELVARVARSRTAQLNRIGFDRPR